ncbi:MAG: hypothetical protein KDK72_09935 [Chlamydiia bacterium]|nr:hypothetical protein [Chlamydiia bacterium]
MLPVSGYAMVFSGALSFVKDSYNNFYGHTIKPLVDDGWLVNTFNFYALGAFPAVKRAMQIKNADKNAYPDLCRFSIGPRINIVVLNSPEFRKQLAAPNRYSEKMRGGDEFNFLNDEIGCKGNAFTEENEETKREYKRLGNNHHFGITALKDKVPQMISIFENLENYRAGNTGHLDFSRLARKLSLELVQRIILERDELIEGLEDAVDIKQKAMTDKILWSPESWLPGFIPTENNKLYNEGSAAFNNAVQELMDNPSGLTEILHEN